MISFYKNLDKTKRLVKYVLGSFLLIASIIYLSSCAAGYKAIIPNNLDFKEESSKSSVGIEFVYSYDVLAERGNKKYANKELNKGVRVVAVMIKNNRTTPISFSENIKLYASGKRVFPMTPESIHGQIKQAAPIYLLYSLLWVVITKCEDNDCNQIPLPIGLPIAIGNMAVASNANKQMLHELNYYNVLYKEINPGETVFGLIGIPDLADSRLDILIDN